MISDKRTKGGWRNWIKYFIWTPWIVAIFMGFVSTKGIPKFDLLYHTDNGVSVGHPGAYIVYFTVITIIVVPVLTAGKRAFCHYICWMAPFMVIGDRIRYFLKSPSLHLIVDKDTCIKCNICNRKCQMSLDVMANVLKGDMRDSECILCGECVDACPKKTIAFSFRKT